MTTGSFAQVNKEKAPTLAARDYKDAPIVNVGDNCRYIVRRLTPTECARLQGFPDNWCSNLGTENPAMDELRFWYNVFADYGKVMGKKPKSLKAIATCESAKENPGEENSFRQLRLDQWVKQSIRWMPMTKWDACAFPVNEKDLEGRICFGGLDLSSTTDITAFVLVFPPEDKADKYIILPYFWVPEETLDLRVRRDHVAAFLSGRRA